MRLLQTYILYFFNNLSIGNLDRCAYGESGMKDCTVRRKIMNGE